MPWDVALTGLDHQTAVNDNSLDLTLMVQQVDASGARVSWNPWFNPVTIRTDAGIPSKGERLTAVSSYAWASKLGPTASWPSWASAYRVRDVRWTSVDNSMQLYRCNLHLSDRTAYCPGPFVMRSDGTSIRQVDRFRDENPTAATTNGTALTSTSIKGSGNKPERFEVTQVVINLSLPWRTDSSLGTYGWPNIADLFAANIRTTNSTTFLGLPVGSVMMTGVEVDTKQHEYIEATLQFVWDEWYHMSQQPIYFEGTSDVVETETVGGQLVPKVQWRSRSRGSTDLTALFNADELQWAQNGWRAFDTSCSDGVNAMMAAGGTYAITSHDPLPSVRSAP